jgi:ATP-dependent DNA ligase
VVDGEIVIATPHGLDFDALQMRPASAQSRGGEARVRDAGLLVAFDLLAWTAAM